MKHWNKQPIRLLGVTVQSLRPEGSASKQLDLFSYEEDAKKAALQKVIEQLKDKYGDGVFVGKKRSIESSEEDKG